ncbi:MAG: T9SS type A sorting domain-containing protein [Bacteroidales bacterium]|nr:T9SS type A sorting domain-containing protein [Bacteroidales bacterium]
MKVFLFIILLIHFSLLSHSQQLTFQNTVFSGPVFTFKKYQNKLFIGAGSAIEYFNFVDINNYQFRSKSHSNDIITGITVIDNYIYANNNGLGINIFKLHDNENLIFKKRILDTIIAGHSPAIILNSNTIVFGVGSYGLIVADISNKENPQILQKIKFPDFLLSVQKFGNIIFASDRSYGIFIFNYEDSTLVSLDTFKINGINYWYYCYVDTTTNKLYVYGHKNLLPIADTVTIVRFDLNTMNFQQYESIYKFYSRPCISITTTNNIVFASCWENGTYAIDFSNNIQPQINYVIPTNSYSIWVDKLNDTIIGIAQLSEGLKVYHVASSNYYLIASIDNYYSDCKGIGIKNNYVYTAIINKGIGIGKIVNDSLKQEGILPLNKVKNIYVCNEYLFALCDDDGTKVYSLQNNIVPQYLTTLLKPTSNGALNAIKHNNYLFVIDCYYQFISRPIKLTVWDLSNLSTPVIISEVLITVQNFPYDRPQIFVDFLYPYLAISCFNDALPGSLHIVDVSNINNPQVVCTLPNIYCGQIKYYQLTNETYLLVATGSSTNGIKNGFKIFRVENNSLTEVSEFISGTNGNRTIGIDNYTNYVFIVQGGLSAFGKIIVTDIQNIYNPQLINEYLIGSNTNHSDLKVYNNYLLHSSGSPGFMLLKFDMQNHIMPIFYDNQIRSTEYQSVFDLLKYNYPITIYDVTGRKIVVSNKMNSYLELNNLHFGIYFIKVNNNIYKIIKNSY